MSALLRPPLSVRQKEAAIKKYRTLNEGIPDWMFAGVYGWAEGMFFDRSTSRWDFGGIKRAGQYLRIPLVRQAGRAGLALLALLEDDQRGLDLLDYCLLILPDRSQNRGFLREIFIPALPPPVHLRHPRVTDLENILQISSSAWTIGLDGRGRFRLQRRVNDTTGKLAQGEMAHSGRAGRYLRDAWQNAYGRNPNPGTAYGDAIRAVEAAARPVLSPKNQRATLGTMIRDVKAKPEKWTTTIGNVETVLGMMQAIWYSHSSRHGTDDETKPANVSQAQAEAAVRFAVTLVSVFRMGDIRLV